MYGLLKGGGHFSAREGTKHTSLATAGTKMEEKRIV